MARGIERGATGPVEGEPISRSGLAAEIGERIVGERANRYYREVFGDRFDGTPNFDHAEGGELALRSLAAGYGIGVPDDDETRRLAIRRMREEIRERAEAAGSVAADDASLLEYLEGVEEGVVF